MRLALVLISSFCLAQGTVLSGDAFSQTTSSRQEPLTPPRGAQADAYRKAVAGEGLQHDFLYLPSGVPLDADVASKSDAGETSPSSGTPAFAMTATAWAILAVFLAGLLFLGFRHRRFLLELFGRRDRAFGASTASAATASAGETRQIDDDLLARLRAEADPRVGLRLLLKRFLALAARENHIVLRRSLTTRELLRSLPGGWRHRADLEQLAGRVELTVFGGREMSRQAYQECLDLAAPLLFRVEGA